MMLRMQYSAAISSLYMNEWELHGVATLDSTRKGSGEGGAKFEVSRDSVAATALLAELVRAGEAAFHSTAATIHARNENVVSQVAAWDEKKEVTVGNFDATDR